MLTIVSCLLGCIGVSQKRNAGNGVVGGNVADLNVCRAGIRPADDGAIDDFEDGNTQVNLEGGRDGYWWREKDEKGSTVGPARSRPAKGAGRLGDGTERSRDDRQCRRARGALDSASISVAKAATTHPSTRESRSRPVSRTGPAGRCALNIGDVNTHKDGDDLQDLLEPLRQDADVEPGVEGIRDLVHRNAAGRRLGGPTSTRHHTEQAVHGRVQDRTGQSFDVWVDDLYLLACK